jgi:hypothetical protein
LYREARYIGDRVSDQVVNVIRARLHDCSDMNQIPILLLVLGTFVLIIAVVVILHPWSGVGVNP